MGDTLDRSLGPEGDSSVTDTAPEVEDAYGRTFAALTGTERIRIASDMFEAAKALVAANIRAAEPGITPADLRGRVFSRLYADDLDARTCATVVAALQDPTR